MPKHVFVVELRIKNIHTVSNLETVLWAKHTDTIKEEPVGSRRVNHVLQI